MRVVADLHIHSCLSPCGALEMGPSDIVHRLKEQGVTHFSLTDHNSTRNCEAFSIVAAREGLCFFPGIEVTTQEEAHVLVYFNSLSDAIVFGEVIESSLLPLPLDAEKMGDQIVVNADEEIEDMVMNYLNVASSFSLDELQELAQKQNGIVVPAHVDKPLFSLISQLGFIPQGEFAALEVSYGAVKQNLYEEYKKNGYPLVTASDSHYPDDVGRVLTVFTAEESDVQSASAFFHSLALSDDITLQLSR